MKFGTQCEMSTVDEEYDKSSRRMYSSEGLSSSSPSPFDISLPVKEQIVLFSPRYPFENATETGSDRS